MATLIEKKLRTISSACITDTELAGILDVRDAQRHGQVKRALKRGDLIHIRRGLYCLNDSLTQTKPNPFELAQKIYWPSCVSLESALAYHKLIPEAVHAITSVTTKRATIFQTPYGNFSYAKIPARNFFLQVERITENNNHYLIAKPWKAICDYIYCYKKNWESSEPLVKSLRIDLEELPKITPIELEELDNYYGIKRIALFLRGLRQELKL